MYGSPLGSIFCGGSLTPNASSVDQASGTSTLAYDADYEGQYGYYIRAFDNSGNEVDNSPYADYQVINVDTYAPRVVDVDGTQSDATPLTINQFIDIQVTFNEDDSCW